MSIQYDGEKSNAWRKDYSREICNHLVNFNKPILQDIYPFIVKHISAVSAGSIEIISHDLNGSSFTRSAPTGFIVLGSFAIGDADTGKINLAMQKGSHLLFSSGPGGNDQRYTVNAGNKIFSGQLPVCIDWCALEFSSDLLPSEFTVSLADEGRSWGEWFAIAIPK